MSHLGSFSERSCLVTQRKKQTLGCHHFCCYLIAFPLFPAFVQLVRCALHARSVSHKPPAHVRGIHLCPLVPAFISRLSFTIASIIETSRSPLLPVFPKPQTPNRVQAPGPLPSPQELNYVWCISVRRRILRDLHNPCSPEHLMQHLRTCTHIDKKRLIMSEHTESTGRLRKCDYSRNAQKQTDLLMSVTLSDLVGWPNTLRQNAITSLGVSSLLSSPHEAQAHQATSDSGPFPWSLAPSGPVCAQGSDKRSWRLAWKGACRAVASAREVVAVAQTAPLIPTGQWLSCHAEAKMVDRQNRSPAAPCRGGGI